MIASLTSCALESATEPPTEQEALETVEQEAVVVKRIPVRVVEMHDCEVDVDAGCTPYATSHLLSRSFERANTVFAPAGIELWVKSVDHVETPDFVVMPSGDEDDENPEYFTFSSVEAQLRRIFPAMPAGAFSSSTQKTRQEWLNAGSALYADPDEVLFVIYDEGQSRGEYPEAGRFARSSIGNMDGVEAVDERFEDPGGILAHELGHYFGLSHSFDGVRGINPTTGNAWTRADRYDLYRCDGQTAAFTSASMLGLCSNIVLVDTGDSTTATADDIPLITVEGVSSDPTDNRFPGVLFDIGGTHNPPDRFRFGVNVMTYYSRWGQPDGTTLDLRAPGRLSATQAATVLAYRDHDQPYYAGERAKHIAGLAKSDGLVANNDRGLRPELGQHTDDMLWLANGEHMTFASKTMPISGTDFEPIAADIDGDGDTDLVWYRPTTGLANVWLSTGNGTFNKVNGVSVGTGATLYAGDFDNDNREELLVYRPGITSSFREWNGTTFVQYRSFSSSGWTPIVGNFDGALGDDIFWYSESGGNVAAWWSTGGTTMTSSFFNPIAIGYRPFAGDFDDDGKDDVFLYRVGSSAPDQVWYGKPDRAFDIRSTSVSGDYRPLVGDFDGDGNSDILWENPDSIVDRIWRGSTRGNFLDEDRISLHGDYVGLVGRFDADHVSDVFWYRQ